MRISIVSKPHDAGVFDESIHRPFVPLLIAWTAGIVFGEYLPGFAQTALLFLVFAFVLICLKIFKGVPSTVLPLALFLLLGYLSLQPWMAPRFSDDHIVHFSDRRFERITGFVAANPQQYARRTRFLLKTRSVVANGTRHPVSGTIRVTVPEIDLGLARGDQIAFPGKIRSLRNFNNPGGFDYQRYMAFQRIHATAYVSPDLIHVVRRTPAKGPLWWMVNSRRVIEGWIDDLQLDHRNAPQVKAVMKALFIGDRSDIDKRLRETFNRAGVAHLLAISGLHVGLVAAIAFWVLRRLLSRIDALLRHGWLQKAAALGTVFPVVYYGLLAGMSPSTQRAVLMATLVFVAVVFEARHDIFNSLALAAWVILILHPPSLFSISFQLSFAAVIAIVMGMSAIPLGRRDPDAPLARTVLRRLWMLFLVSLLATLGTLPLLMRYFNQVSLVGMFVNLLVVPLIGGLVVPLGLFAVAVHFVHSSIGGFLLALCGGLLSIGLDVIGFFSAFPMAALKTITPSLLEITSYYLLLWGVMVLLQANGSSPMLAKPPSGRWRSLTAKICIALSLVVMVGDTFYWLHRRFWHSDLRVTVLDVGQGSAALVEVPKGDTMLIDGGGFPDRSLFDTGALIIAPFLWRNKIATIDTLVLSHPNSDHLNGLIFIAEHFNVTRAWTNNEDSQTKGYADFKTVLQQQDIEEPLYAGMQRVHRINGVDVAILAPPRRFLEKAPSERWRNKNNNSMVLKISFGSTAFLFPGDIMAAAEKDLVRRQGGILKSTVLLAPHHGSRSSSSAAFLDAVDPAVVVVSAGWHNRFGFPHACVLERYRKKAATVLRTDEDGAVMMSTNGRRLTIETVIGPHFVLAYDQEQ